MWKARPPSSGPTQWAKEASPSSVGLSMGPGEEICRPLIWILALANWKIIEIIIINWHLIMA